MKLPTAVIYTRRGCHLCEEAYELLVRYGISTTLINIDSNHSLASRYDTCVPVVLIDGKERFRGRINEILLRRLIDR